MTGKNKQKRLDEAFLMDALLDQRDKVRMHVFRGANVDAREKKDGNCALHFAAWGSLLEMAQLLLECGANPDIQDRLGRTPLHTAALHGNVEVAVLLVEGGASLAIIDQDRKTPLDLCGEKSMRAELLAAKARRRQRLEVQSLLRRIAPKPGPRL